MKHISTTFNQDKFSYLSIYHQEIPDFLNDYLNIPEMQRLKGIDLFCGCYYTKLFDCTFFYSRYDHSLGVALIIWHFTHDKIQTLAGLFHDVSSPVFSHVVDFLNNDHLHQVSTEKSNKTILANSSSLDALLRRDNIPLEAIVDYKLYPIADNQTPRLSADRLEYMLSTGYIMGHFLTIEDIRKIYQDITITTNEDQLPELGFKTLDIAELFTSSVSKVAKIFISPKDKLALQLLADILKLMVQDHYVTMEQFYLLTEAEIIEMIKNSPYASIFAYFQNLQTVYISDKEIKHKYCLHIHVKKRYINPLVLQQRITQVSNKANDWINEILNDSQDNYFYIDLEDFRDGN